MIFFKRFFLFLASFLVVLIMCDLFIWSAGITTLSSTEFYEDIGRGRRKNMEYIYFNEGIGMGHYNAFRYAGEAYSPERTPNTFRVALLGDSYVESIQVFERHYFGKVAEQELEKKKPCLDYEVLNFGRSGSDIGDDYAYQELFTNHFQPDLTVYLVSTDDLKLKYYDPLRPKTVLEKGQLVINQEYDPDVLAKYQATKYGIQHSTLIHMLNNGRKKTKEVPVGSVLLGKVYEWFTTDSDQKPLNNDPFTLDPVTREIIKALRGQQVMMVNRGDEPFPSCFLDLCMANGIPVFDLSPVLTRMKEDGRNPHQWPASGKYGHWNHEAHQEVGKALAGFISEWASTALVMQQDSTDF